MRTFSILFVLMIVLTGCGLVYQGPSCEPPAVAMTDVNGNTVCVIPDDANETEPLNETEEMAEDADEDNATAQNETEQSAAELLDDMREEAGIDTSLPTKVVEEGEIVSFPNLQATDPDGDEITYTYSQPLDENGEWQTGVGDAGEYTATITASDGVNEVTQRGRIIVESDNRAPEIDPISDMTVEAGELVDVQVDVTDPDGDTLEVEYSEPISLDGTWQTEEGDEGIYQIEVTASDGELQSIESFQLTVVSGNEPPAMSDIPDKSVDEGETVTFDPEVIDPDGDEVTITYSGWMDSSTYQTDYDDAGTHLVTVTASDGVHEVSQDVTVTVRDVNRAPEFNI